jgi:hypothetical protein
MVAAGFIFQKQLAGDSMKRAAPFALHFNKPLE